MTSARALVDLACGSVDSGETEGVLPTMAQRQAARAAHSTADLCVQLHGGSGLVSDGEPQRLWRDTRLHLIGPIAQEVSADYLGRVLAARGTQLTEAQ